MESGFLVRWLSPSFEEEEEKEEKEKENKGKERMELSMKHDKATTKNTTPSGYYYSFVGGIPVERTREIGIEIELSTSAGAYVGVAIFSGMKESRMTSISRHTSWDPDNGNTKAVPAPFPKPLVDLLNGLIDFQQFNFWCFKKKKTENFFSKQEEHLEILIYFFCCLFSCSKTKMFLLFISVFVAHFFNPTFQHLHRFSFLLLLSFDSLVVLCNITFLLFLTINCHFDENSFFFLSFF